MMWEYLKSIVLGLLVTTSLLVTFALWTYQPEYDELNKGNKILEVETKLTNGTQQSISSVINPELLLFHQNGRLFSLNERSEEKSLYEKILTWPLTNFYKVEEVSKSERESALEITYPTSVPLSTLVNIFTVNEETEFRAEETEYSPYNVDRMLISFAPQKSNNYVYFVSDDNSDTYWRASIRNFDVYNFVAKYLNNTDMQREYFSIDDNRENPIYLPESEISVPMDTMTGEDSEVDTMKNILFNNPQLVKQNSTSTGQAFYNIDNRLLQTLKNEKLMVFEKVQSEESQSMLRQEIIKHSLNDINDHNGWTDETYNLFNINSRDNTIDYRLYKNGYPVLHDNLKGSNGLGLISQQWRNQDLIVYKRPLIRLNSPLETQQITLPSGRDVLSYIEKSRDGLSSYFIDDIKIGYIMKVTGNNSLVITIEPSWFIKEGEDWEPLTIGGNE
ncbi:YycH family regulatory protein [Pontibacillus salipaludis]|uniref:Regulatory protein YycH domain-containing protein n=1 Tax=Pontibacillus salipaludis TaxID=1697394 RepID=A0ABQ1PSS2_9BACI|nr:two-component system activity regulator YycH [Pontibacillus salipaludis]GGD02419.1 hypothetical protein GCM10011389_07360 [Pontibacillus salipaludis]